MVAACSIWKNQRLLSIPQLILPTMDMNPLEKKCSAERISISFTQGKDTLDNVNVTFSEDASIDMPPPTQVVCSGDPARDSFPEACKMGRRFQDSGNFDGALREYRRALLYKNKTIETEPKNIQAAFACVLFDIGCIHVQREDYTKSVETFQYCLDLRRVCFGSNDLAVANVLYKLASIYSKVGDQDYSLQLLLECLAILLFSSPHDDPSLIEVWTAIGTVQQSTGMIGEAIDSFREAEILKKKGIVGTRVRDRSWDEP